MRGRLLEYFAVLLYSGGMETQVGHNGEGRKRVVITGMGLVSPVGNSAAASWESIKAGRSGIAPITLFDTSDESYAVRIAGEVKGFCADDWGIDKKLSRKMSRMARFLTAASVEAARDAGFEGMAFGELNSGIVAGVGIGALDAYEAGYAKYFNAQAGVSRIPPLTAPLMLENEAAANVSMMLGIKGPSWTISTACASGSDALGAAMDLVRSGRVDICIAAGCDACITGFGIGCFQALLALTRNWNEEPERASRPFDKDRSGFVMAEGAGAIVVESEEMAVKRGAKIHTVLAGYGASSDAHHITAPLKDGSGGALAIKRALADAGVEAQEVDYYNAHGTSTEINDAAETNMIKAAFGKHAYKMKVSSTKSMTGHMVGAAGVAEAIFCVKAIEDGFFPPTINLENPDIAAGCDLDYVPNKGVAGEINTAVSASLGFGGHNGAVVMKKWLVGSR